MQEKRPPKTEYRTMGGAAYDVNYGANRERQPVVLPEEKQQPERVRRVRESIRVSPFTIVGIAATVFLAVLVVFGYVRLYESTAQIASLEEELSQLRFEQTKLENIYDSKYNLAEIEKKAKALGMTQPRPSQTVYLNLGDTDFAEIAPADNRNPLLTALLAIRDSIMEFVEYLS